MRTVDDAGSLATAGPPALASLRRDLMEAEGATQRAKWPNRADEVRAEISRVEASLAAAAVAAAEELGQDEIVQRKLRTGRKGRVERARRAPQPGEAA